MTRPLLRWLAQPWSPLTAALVGVALTLPALGVGLIIDDYFHRAVLLGTGPVGVGARPLLDLFSFIPAGPRHQASLQTGLLTWWAHPHLVLALFRPLTALTHMLDYALWPDAFLLQHLHSLLWYGLAIFAVATCYRQIHGATAVAGLAALFFAVDDAHAMSVGWLANRHALVALTIGVFTLQAHLRWRRGGGSVWALVASLGFLSALLCGEAGIATAAYLVAWQLTMDERPAVQRLAALLPYLALIVVWRVLYEFLGYATTGSGLYIDPAHRPFDFSLALAERWPILQLAQWLRVPSDLYVFLPRAGQIALGGLGAVVCVLLLGLLMPLLRAQRTARFWATGMSLALVPFCAGFPMDRLLLFSGVGACALLALFIEHVGLLRNDRFAAPLPSRAARFAAILLILHGPLAALLLLLRVVTLPLFNAPIEAVVASAPPTALAPQQTLVFVSGTELVGYLPIVQSLQSPATAYRRVALLTSMFSDNLIERESLDTLVLTASGGMVRTTVEQLLRSPDAPFKVGDRIDRPDFTAIVRSITADGRPERVAFQFNAALESPEYRWMAWTEEGAKQFEPPAIGSRLHLPAVGALAAGRVAPGIERRKREDGL
jgi:hypothetical protein